MFRTRSAGDVQNISEKLLLFFKQMVKSLQELWKKDIAVNLHQWNHQTQATEIINQENICT